MRKKVYLVGYASGLAGADIHAADGPICIQQSPLFAALNQNHYEWNEMIRGQPSQSKRLDESIRDVCEALAKCVSKLIKDEKQFLIIGGDHTSAIGTWSGAYDALHHQGDIGLIWIDAHMDSHTSETTESGRIHGMPAASLLGYGFPTLSQVLHDDAKIKPENMCLIGVRSFEQGEADLIKRLNIRTYFMDEVNERGFKTVMAEAVDRVTRNTIKYGISLDLDSIDPIDAPGVDVPEPNGIRFKDLMAGLSNHAHDPRLITTEIVEFDPTKDKNQLTEKIIIDLIQQLGCAHD